MTSGPVFLIGLDAADLTRIERLAACGRMPNLAAILAGGVCGRVRSLPAGLSAMIWPKWFEGGRAGSWYFPKKWNPARMRLEWITATSGDPEPFWCDLDRRGLRVCVADVPQAPLGPLQHGVFVQGWQAHDLFERSSEPAGLWKELAKTCGTPFLDRERYGPQTAARLMALREQLLAATAQAGAMGRELMRRGSFELFVMVLGGLHRGGHYLWNTGQIDTGDLGADDLHLLENGLDEVYQAADSCVGQLIDGVPSDARILVFSLHGMGPNHGWSERLQSFAEAVTCTDSVTIPVTPLQRLKRLIPASVAQRAIDHLPDKWRKQLLEFTSAQLRDWQHTPWFVLPSDLSGFIRLNLQGREALGIVAPGTQARALEDELIGLFSQIEDLEGRRIVAEIERTDKSVAASDPLRRFLPDLLLLWNQLSASDTAGLRLDGREIARWPLGQRFSSGRSGNHSLEGWFAAIGPGLVAGRDETLREIDGIVPAVYHWLGLEPPSQFVGSAFPSLIPCLSAPTLSIER
jgi:predicted AlkP superfamily phosphohydrolase/phosphomutase